jgi:hypothetical protein
LSEISFVNNHKHNAYYGHLYKGFLEITQKNDISYIRGNGPEKYLLIDVVAPEQFFLDQDFTEIPNGLGIGNFVA